MRKPKKPKKISASDASPTPRRPDGDRGADRPHGAIGLQPHARGARHARARSALMPTGAYHAVGQIGLPQFAHETRVSTDGWLAQRGNVSWSTAIRARCYPGFRATTSLPVGPRRARGTRARKRAEDRSPDDHRRPGARHPPRAARARRRGRARAGPRVLRSSPTGRRTGGTSRTRASSPCTGRRRPSHRRRRRRSPRARTARRSAAARAARRSRGRRRRHRPERPRTAPSRGSGWPGVARAGRRPRRSGPPAACTRATR